MRRKVFPGKNPLCVCGHRMLQHYQYTDKESGGCKVKNHELLDKFESVFCACEKFFDRRHCKIKESDPVLQVFKKRKRAWHIVESVWYDYVELTQRSGVSRPTVSRRCNLFLLLGLVNRQWGMGFHREYMYFRLNWLILAHLREEGIVAD